LTTISPSAQSGESPGRPLSVAEYEKLTRLNVEEFQRFCDLVGERVAERGLSQQKLANMLADD
jgi:hypothetical protein